MENGKKQKILIIFLIMIIFVLLGYIGFSKLSNKKLVIEDETKKYDETTNYNEIKESDESLNITFDEIVDLVKDYYYQHNLVEENNLESWIIDSSTYVGYYNDSKNIRFYLVEGTYTCKDNGDTCVYMSVIDGLQRENFKIYAAIDESGNEKVIQSVEQLTPQKDNFTEINKEIPSNNEKVCKGFLDAVYVGEYHDSTLMLNEYLTLNLKKDGTFKAIYENSEAVEGTYIISNNKLKLSACPSLGPCDEKIELSYDITSDCTSITWGSSESYQYKITKK